MNNQRDKLFIEYGKPKRLELYDKGSGTTSIIFVYDENGLFISSSGVYDSFDMELTESQLKALKNFLKE